ncbi:MAG: TolB-like 6-bladed beta-propeller domain-containing protein, partial [Tannerellaceae bacterium]|nr:TolB-like 6-bladed beta-propeller domain-containing protein [Tannerellaceae bacterium]
EENRLYLFCKLTDLIEIYDLSGNLIRRLHGPDGFYPNVKQKKWADGASTVSTRESRDAYFEPCVVEDMVFVIYSGAEYENRETKTILVFDKDGNPLKQFKLSENIFTFAADEKSKMIYVSTMEDFEIKRFAYE